MSHTLVLVMIPRRLEMIVVISHGAKDVITTSTKVSSSGSHMEVRDVGSNVVLVS